MPARIYDDTYGATRIRIRGIGVDLNPLPDLIPEATLEINPDIDGQGEPPSTLITELRVDDVTVLATVPDGSVDILYSMDCLPYVEDVLRALEAGWRVLKEWGEMVFHTTYSTNSDPNLAYILEHTPGADEVFCLLEDAMSNQDFPDPDLIVGVKKPGTSFRGFPFTLQPRQKSSLVQPTSHYDYVVTGRYIAR